jgi:hypothetical protein
VPYFVWREYGAMHWATYLALGAFGYFLVVTFSGE